MKVFGTAVVALLALALLGTFWALGRQPERAVGAGAPTPLVESPRIEQSELAAAAEESEPRSVEDPEAPSAEPVPVSGSTPVAEAAYSVESWATAGPLERTPVPDSVFDALYPEDMSYAQLYGAWSGKAVTWQQEALALGQSAFDRGDFEERRMPLDADGEVVSSWIGNGDDTPHCVVRQGGEVPADSAQVAWLRYDEHPELYDRRDEWLYLMRRFQAIPQSER